MKILVINAGSSSLKYQLIDMTDESVVAKGLCERITMDSSVLTQKVAGKDKLVIESPMPTHKEAMELVLKALLDEKNGAIKSVKEIGAVGHRVLHSAWLLFCFSRAICLIRNLSRTDSVNQKTVVLYW